MNNMILSILALATTLVSCNNDNSSVTSQSMADCNTIGVVEQSSNEQVQAMRQAMLTFRNSLDSTLLKQASNCLNSDRVTKWHNTPGERDGISYADLSDGQITEFKNILQLFLSSAGYKKVDEITMLAEGYLSTKNSRMWSPNKYSIDMFGDPKKHGSWGFQLDGHHCAVNFLVHGDNVSIVPAFLGGEPVKGTFNGVSFDIFEDERDFALTLYNGFSASEKAAAVSDGSSATMEVGPARRNGQVDPFAGNYDYSGFAKGLKYSDMNDTTQSNLIVLMKEYVYNLNAEFADKWWADVMNKIDDTYFIWLDNVERPTTTTQFYYRIYNPYLWVEYNMENPVGRGLEDWNHIHTITRIPNNPETTNRGDYGIFAQIINKDDILFLAQHYTRAGHHNKSVFLFDYFIESEGGFVHNHHN